MFRALAVVVIAFTALLAGCSSGAGEATTPKAGSSVSAADFGAAAKLPDTIILDVRTPQEFAEGHLPGALNLDVEGPDFAAELQTLDPAKHYAVYCRSANRSKVAMDVMGQLGFKSYFDLAGGIKSWASNGGQVVTG